MVPFAVFSFCLLIAIRNAWHTSCSIRWIEENNRPDEFVPQAPLRFVILIPLLRETAIVGKLLRRMALMDRGAATEVRFVFITTSREGDGPGTTADALRGELRRYDGHEFTHLHCDTGTDNCKADQLNFALHRIGLAGARARDVFIGVYDADSSPDPRTLSHIAARVHAIPDLKAIQQVPLYFQNVGSASGLRELYLLTRPFHNALFALTVEVPGMRRQPAVFARPKGSPRRNFDGWLSHGLGHGQFFRLDVLTELGGFRPPSCDTQFGHALAMCGIPIYAHPLLDVGQTPDSIKVLIRQGVVWFNSMNTCWLTRRYVAKAGFEGFLNTAAWVMISRLMHSNLAWAVYPVVFLAAMIWCLGTAQWFLAAYGVLAWATYLIPLAMILSRFDLWTKLCGRFEPIVAPSTATRIGIIIMFGVEKLGSCISPLLWCVQASRSRLRHRPIVLHKTERAGI